MQLLGDLDNDEVRLGVDKQALAMDAEGRKALLLLTQQPGDRACQGNLPWGSGVCSWPGYKLLTDPPPALCCGRNRAEMSQSRFGKSSGNAERRAIIQQFDSNIKKN